jgi:hypothetical protein
LANPIGWYTYDGHPTVLIYTPQTNDTFSASNATHLVNVPVAFGIRKPENWLISSVYPNGSEYKSKLISVDIRVDGNLYQSIDVNSYLSSPIGFSKDTGNLTIGEHTLVVLTHCQGWEEETHGAWIKELLYDSVSDQVNFTVHADIWAQSPPITPSPTPIIYSTIEPTSTPIIREPPEIPLYTGDFVFVAIVLVAGLLVIYFKKLRKPKVMQAKANFVFVIAILFNVVMIPVFSKAESDWFSALTAGQFGIVDNGPILNTPLVVFILAISVNLVFLFLLARRRSS